MIRNLPDDEEQVNYQQARLVAQKLDTPTILVNWANATNSPNLTNTGGSIVISSQGDDIAVALLAVTGQLIFDLDSWHVEWLPDSSLYHE